jgi:hypothetical protein
VVSSFRGVCVRAEMFVCFFFFFFLFFFFFFSSFFLRCCPGYRAFWCFYVIIGEKSERYKPATFVEAESMRKKKEKKKKQKKKPKQKPYPPLDESDEDFSRTPSMPKSMEELFHGKCTSLFVEKGTKIKKKEKRKKKRKKKRRTPTHRQI